MKTAPRLILLVLPALLMVLEASGSHIMGGELQLTHLRAYQYEVGLNVFFDEVNGNVGARDDEVFVSVYRRSDNAFMQELELDREQIVPLRFSNKACVGVDMDVSVFNYRAVVEFRYPLYSDPGGYYLAWERCCRNDNINNIVSPSTAGVTFYLDFEAPVPGQSVQNSSPIFNFLTSDYACLNEPTTIDFGATDPNGDELVYSLDIPLRGHATRNNPVISPQSAPYLEVVWQPGYGLNTMITGNPPLTIDSQTGELRFTPNRVGIFVIAVLCEERRNGQVIGRVHREYQILVTNCPPNGPPEISLSLDVNDTSATYKGEVLLLKNNCELTALFSDPDVGQSLTLTQVPLNYEDEQSILGTNPRTIVAGDRQASLLLCRPPCPPDDIAGKIYQSYLIIEDDHCPKSQKDTVLLSYQYAQDENKPPVITLSYTEGTPLLTPVDSLLEVIVTATDPDSGQTLTMRAVGEGFLLENYNTDFITTASGPARVEKLFRWRTDCRPLQLPQPVSVLFTVSDGFCPPGGQDSVRLKLAFEDLNLPAVAYNPANVFTPNDDGLNDVFTLPSLPKDNCTYGSFANIKIYNRFGRPVFESSDRNFVWKGEGHTAGVYFYILQYDNQRWRSWLTLMR